ncbi:MAG: UbiH/UbiF/VisC/COQ6 family ubiquinone biosynthesis hydroxylase [Pseudomonadales bacterium]|nr:UbiH/UbiF/VisC/COQ6 family ubiquinone biosynthesis hydroxylase [Pseudomonadales bacterium]
MTETDILVVGGGMVGLCFANGLQGSGLDVTVVDGMPSPVAADAGGGSAPVRTGYALQSGVEPRVSSVNLASELLLRRAGGWPEAVQAPVEGMQVWDGRGTAEITFDGALIGEAHLGTIVENQAIVAALHDTAVKRAEATLLFGTRVTAVEPDPVGYRVLLDSGEAISCRLLVGADGAQSRIRELMNIRTIEWSYQQQAMVTTIETALPHGNIARQCFTDQGPLAFLPLRHPNLSSIVWSTNVTESLMALDDEALCQRLTAASEEVLGAVLGCDRRFSFPLRQRHATRYVGDHLVLIGDAAHTIHPLAGQGANLGFADARALCAALQRCRIEGLTPDDALLLKGYQHERRPENLLMTGVMEGFKRLFDTSDPGVNWLRNTGMNLVAGSRPLKTMIARLATGS